MDTVILGAGGHARVILAALLLRGVRPIGCLSPVAPDSGWPSEIGYLGDDSRLAELDPARVRIINGVGSVGETLLRRKLFEWAKALGHTFLSIVHPTAIIIDHQPEAEGVQVMAGAIIQNGVVFGPNVLINTGAIVDHDCRIGAHGHVATGARLSGGVELGIGVHLGTGASVIQGIHVGDGAIVGAGAVVIRDVAAGSTVVGNPARPVAIRNTR